MTRWNVDTGTIDRLVFLDAPVGRASPLTSIERITGPSLDLIRNSADQLGAIRQRIDGRTILVEYNASGLVTEVMLQTADGTIVKRVNYEFDNDKQLRTVTNSNGHVLHYDYDQSGRMIREESADGSVFFWSYDNRGRCVRTSGLDGFDEKTLRYYERIGYTEVTDSLGSTRRYRYNARGQVTLELDPLGGKRETQLDEHGRIIAINEPGGAVTTYTYDEAGNRSKIVDCHGNETLLAYDKNHLPVKLVDPAGNVWQRRYDRFNRLVEGVNPLGGRWIYQYDRDGNLVRVTDPAGATLEQSFSDHGEIRERTDWEGNTTRYQVDPMGRVISRTDALNRTTRIRYDQDGRILDLSLPDGSRIAREYDAAGNLTYFVDAKGRATRLRWGTCNRLLEYTRPDGRSMRFYWGTEPGRLERIRNENGETHDFHYDAAGRVISEISFDQQTLAYQRNARGFCTSVQTAEGTISYVLDPGGRVLEQQFPDGTSATFDYDAFGRIKRATNSDATVTFERDALGNVLREATGAFAVESQYDAAGSRKGLQTSLGLKLYCAYDGNSRVKQVVVDGIHVLTFWRDAAGREIARSLPESLRLDQDYDLAGRLSGQRVMRGNPGKSAVRSAASVNSILERSYGYDSSGMLTRVTDPDGQTNFEYDATERLVKVTRDQQTDELFEYDAVDNIVERAMGQASERLDYDTGSRLRRRGSVSYSFDRAGRLQQRIEPGADSKEDVWSYRWDALDQLRSIQAPGGTLAEYKYDALGRRIEKRVGEAVTCFVWDGNNVLHELTASTLRSTWVYEPDSVRPLLTLQEGRACSVVNDHRGRPMAIIETNGEVAWRLEEDACGRVLGQPGPRGQAIRCPLGFPGQWHDLESGLHYNRFRYYEPESGRFVSTDPIRLNGGYNAYLYALNPVNWIDPLGLANGPCANNEFPDDPNELTQVLGVQPTVSLTPDGTVRMVWQPNPNTRIRYESHPGNPALPPTHPDFAPRHHGPHYHVEVRANPNVSWNNHNNVTKVQPPGYVPGMGTGFLPGERFP